MDRLSTDKVEHPWMSVEHYPDRHPRLSRRRFVPVLPDEKEVHHQLRVSPMVRRTVVNNRHFAISQFFDFGDDITLFIIIYIYYVHIVRSSPGTITGSERRTIYHERYYRNAIVLGSTVNYRTRRSQTLRIIRRRL